MSACAVLLFILAVGMDMMTGVLPAGASENPPQPNIAHYVPSTDVVSSDAWVHLTNKGPAQFVVAYQGGQPTSGGYPSRDLIILSWDHFAKRWVVVWDGAKTQSPQSNSSTDGLARNAVLPSSANVFKLSYAPITSGKGETDLEFWASYNFGANGNIEVGIVHYNGQVASMAYFNSFAPGHGSPRVIGKAPHQELRVPIGWLTDDDPECCAVRTYVDTVALQDKAFRGGDHTRAYVVTSNTQSWLGVYADLPKLTSGGTHPDPVVLSVVSGGPAEGILEPGDELVSVAGISAPSSSDLGPPVIDEIAKALPGTTIALTIERAGTQRVVNVRLGSTASKAYTSSSAPVPGFIGVDITSMTPALQSQYGFVPSAGAVVLSVASNSPAANTGLVLGDVITSFGSTAIATAEGLQRAAELTPPGTSVQVGYYDTSGTVQTVDLTMGAYPTDGVVPEIATI